MKDDTAYPDALAKGHPATPPSDPTQPYCTNGSNFTVEEKYVLGLAGEQITQLDGSNNWQHTNIWAGSQLLATYDQESNSQQPLHFNVTDPLGTKRIQTTSAGVPELTCLSLPFGDGPDCTGSAQEATKHRFTGKERDVESGLDYFGARYYASSMGRWMSPDWVNKPEAVPYSDLANPQSLNLYGYVGNNPISRVDSDGHEQQLLTPEEVQRGNDVFVGAVKGVWNLGASVWNTGANLLNAQGATSGMSFGIPTAPIAQYSNDTQHLAGDVAQLGVIVADAAASLTRGTAAADAVATPKAPTVPDSIPAGPSPRPTAAQQNAINEMGNAHGCSTCGTTSPGTKTGNWVGDHQPPTALNPKGNPQVYKPQCLQCSRRQGGEVAAQIRANKKEQTPQ